MNNKIILNILKLIYQEGVEGCGDAAEDAIARCIGRYSSVEYLGTVCGALLKNVYLSGYHGIDYDQDFVAELFKDRFGNAIHLFDEARVIQSIPAYIKELIGTYNLTLAGGSVLRMILNKEWEGDWDLFRYNYDCKIKLYDVINAINGQVQKISEYNSSFGTIYTGQSSVGKIQVINQRLENPTENFDFTICQFSIVKSNKKLVLRAPIEAVESLSEMTLDFNRFSQNRLNQNRIQKYIGRGFLPSKQIQEFLNNSNELSELNETEGRGYNNQSAWNTLKPKSAKKSILLTTTKPTGLTFKVDMPTSTYQIYTDTPKPTDTTGDDWMDAVAKSCRTSSFITSSPYLVSASTKLAKNNFEYQAAGSNPASEIPMSSPDPFMEMTEEIPEDPVF